jgi:hypothetical protein
MRPYEIINRLKLMLLKRLRIARYDHPPRLSVKPVEQRWQQIGPDSLVASLIPPSRQKRFAFLVTLYLAGKLVKQHEVTTAACSLRKVAFNALMRKVLAQDVNYLALTASAFCA